MSMEARDRLSAKPPCDKPDQSAATRLNWQRAANRSSYLFFLAQVSFKPTVLLNTGLSS